MEHHPPALTHREACYELRRTAKLYGDDKITVQAWYRSVCRILDARARGAPLAQAEQPQPSP